jgi:uncharacterized membrane protein YoaK (UPF0700 family)
MKRLTPSDLDYALNPPITCKISATEDKPIRVDPGRPGPAVPSVDDSLGTKLLPFVLSVIAGSVDIIGLLGLGGLFTAHITGNIVVLAAKLVVGQQAPLSHLISVPVFMVVLALTRLLVAGLERIAVASLVPLLLLQFLLLLAYFTVSVANGPGIDPSAAIMILAAMSGVAAMAVQNEVARVSLSGAPSTAVMTTNVTLVAIDVGEILFGRNAGNSVKARARAKHTWPAIVGFLIGCALGAACESAFGLRALVLPAGFALLALAMAMAVRVHTSKGGLNERHQN